MPDTLSSTTFRNWWAGGWWCHIASSFLAVWSMDRKFWESSEKFTESWRIDFLDWIGKWLTGSAWIDCFMNASGLFSMLLWLNPSTATWGPSVFSWPAISIGGTEAEIWCSSLTVFSSDAKECDDTLALLLTSVCSEKLLLAGDDAVRKWWWPDKSYCDYSKII